VNRTLDTMCRPTHSGRLSPSNRLRTQLDPSTLPPGAEYNTTPEYAISRNDSVTTNDVNERR
jgi:hypothetical protein